MIGRKVAAPREVWYNWGWKRGRVVEGARLEIVWAEMSRRFESSRFRQPLWRGWVMEVRFCSLLLGFSVMLQEYTRVALSSFAYGEIRPAPAQR